MAEENNAAEILARRQRDRRLATQDRQPKFHLTDQQGGVVATASSKDEALELVQAAPELTLRRSRKPVEGAQKARDVSQALRERGLAEDAVEPYRTESGGVNVVAALRGGVDPEVLEKLFTAKSIRESQLTANQLDEIEPFRTKSGGVDLVAAIDEGVSEDTLNALFESASIEQSQTFISDRAILQPFTDAEGRINAVAALEAGISEEVLARALAAEALTGAQTTVKARASIGDRPALEFLQDGGDPEELLDAGFDDDEVADLVAVVPFADDAGSINVTDAINAGVPTDVLERVGVSSESIGSIMQRNSDMAVIEPFTNDDGQINVSDALNAGVSADVLGRLGVDSETIGSVTQRTADMAAIQPFINDDGLINVSDALGAGVPTDVLGRLGLPTSVTAPPLAPPPVVEPVTTLEPPASLSASTINALTNEIAVAQDAVLGGIAPGNDLANAQRNAQQNIDEFWDDFNLDVAGLRDQYTTQLAFFPRAVESAEDHIWRLTTQDRNGRYYEGNHLTPEQRDNAVKEWQERIEEMDRQSIETRQTLQDFDRYVADLRPVVQQTINESYAAIPGIVGNQAGVDTPFLPAKIEPVLEPVLEPVPVTAETVRALEAQGFTPNQIAAIVAQPAELVRVRADLNLPVDATVAEVNTEIERLNAIERRPAVLAPPEDFEGGIDTPAVQAELARARLLAERTSPPEDFEGGIDTPRAQAQLVARRRDLEQAGVRVNPDGTFFIPDNANESQIAAIQRHSELGRREIIAASREAQDRRDFLSGKGVPPVVALNNPSAARAFSAQQQAADIAERAERRALITEQGIPSTIAEQQARLEDDREFFLRASMASKGQLSTGQQAEFESTIRQLGVVNQTVEALKAGDISIDEGQDILEAMPLNPTEADINSAERLLTARIRLASVTPIVGAFISPWATAREWEQAGGKQRAIDVGLDALGIVTLGIPVLAGARSAGATTGIARAVKAGGAIATSELLGPIELITAPGRALRGIGRTVWAPVEVLATGGRRLPASIEQSRATLRFPAEAGRGTDDPGVIVPPAGTAKELIDGVFTPIQMKEAVSKAALAVMQSGISTPVPVGRSNTSIIVKPSLIQEVLGQGATSASPDIRNILAGDVVIGGSEGGLFVSVSPHTRFADATSAGAKAPDLNEITKLQDAATRLSRVAPGSEEALAAQKEADEALLAWKAFDDNIQPAARSEIENLRLPNAPLPGVILINNRNLLRRLRGAEAFRGGGTKGVVIGAPGNEPKLFRGRAEVEAVLPNNTVLPKASQRIFFVGPDGTRYAIAVVGEPLTQAQRTAMGLRGPQAALQNVLAPPIAMTFDNSVEVERLLAQAGELRASGDIEQSLVLEKQAEQLLAELAEATNILRADNAAQALRQAQRLETEAAAARIAGKTDLALTLSREADTLRDVSRAFTEQGQSIASSIRSLRAGGSVIRRNQRGGFNVGARQSSAGISDRAGAGRLAERGAGVRVSLGTVERPNAQATEQIRELRVISERRTLSPADAVRARQIVADIARLPTDSAERRSLDSILRTPGIVRIPGIDDIVRITPGDDRLRSRILTNSPVRGRSPSPDRSRFPGQPPPPVRIPPSERTLLDADDANETTTPRGLSFRRDSTLPIKDRNVNLRVAGINRGIFDTTVDMVSGEVRTVKDLEQVPEGKVRPSFTALSFGEIEPSVQRVKWGALDLFLGPNGSFQWTKANAPEPEVENMRPAHELRRNPLRRRSGRRL